MADQWFVTKGGKRYGPIEYAQLVQDARGGKVTPADLVWKEGMLEWQPASRVGGLFETSAPAVMPPPIPQQPIGYAGPRTDPQRDIGQDAGVRMLIPVGRSGWAIASGYLGLFSVLILFAPFALLTGILALRDMKKHPEKHGAGRAWFGIIMGTIFTLVLLVAIATFFIPA